MRSWKIKLFVFFLLLFIVSACGKKDLTRFEAGRYYVASDSEGDVVLYLEDVSRKTIAGKWYEEDCDLAKPHRFVAKSRWFRRGMRSDSLVFKTGSSTTGNTLTLELLMDDGWHTMDFHPWEQPQSMKLEKDYPYHDSLYQVKCEKDVVYARAKGYWTSYPEPANEDSYLSIMMEKMNDEDMTQKYWDLKMDIYTPVINDTMSRPLLMLIHGGAFFNGDKASRGYVEWAEHFASRGYVVASINYRIGFAPLGKKHVDRAGYRAVQDAYAAMCYLLRHPERYPIDKSRLFVGGTSAGAITSLNLAFMENWNRPECTYEGFLHQASQLPFFDQLIPEDICLEDLGNIEAVAGTSGSVDFSINTVINMWGAVHDVGMLSNPGKETTAILSFHGDADSVVAYNYDYPFNKIKTPARDFIRDIRESISDNNSWFGNMAYNVLYGTENLLVPLNHFMCNKMYGSQCIHEKALELNMVSELHTKAGGGHSLHVDHGRLSDYYTLITDTTTRFLYLRMFPHPGLNASCDKEGRRWCVLEDAGELDSIQWEAVGGLVLEAEPDKARVIYFADADQHGLRLSGQQKNGEPYQGEYDVWGTLGFWHNFWDSNVNR